MFNPSSLPHAPISVVCTGACAIIYVRVKLYSNMFYCTDTEITSRWQIFCHWDRTFGAVSDKNFAKTTFPVQSTASSFSWAHWAPYNKAMLYKWSCTGFYLPVSLQWRYNVCDGVSNHQPHDCLLNRLFRRRSKKTSKLRVTGLCAGNSPVTGEFPTQRASNAENVFIWWHHHVMFQIFGSKHK